MFKYTPQTIPQNIFVIGGGGTGSRLMPMLVQFIRSITRGQTALGWLENPTIWIVDDDVVETKNLLRQNFIQNDVGKPKAAVLAERYGRAYGVDVVPLVLRVDSNGAIHGAINEVLAAKNELNNNRREGTKNYSTVIQNAIVISCVDSSEARRSILNSFVINSQAPGQGAFFIDAGNEDSFGQVNFFNASLVYHKDVYDSLRDMDKIPKFVGSVCDLDFLPMDLRYYRDLVDTESTASCADLNQTLAINAMMATTIMGVVQNYYYRKPFTYNCVRLSLDGGNATEYLTFNSVRRLALDSEEVSPFMYGEVRVTEKKGNTTQLNFARYCYQQSLMYNYASQLKEKIAADQAEIERARREEERKRKAEEAERERAEKLKALAASAKEAEKTKKLSKTTVVVEKGELPENPTSLNISVENGRNTASVRSEATVAEMTATTPTTPTAEVPPLVPTPRRRRSTPRAAVMENVDVAIPTAVLEALRVPDTWVEVNERS